MIPSSYVVLDSVAMWMSRGRHEKQLCILASQDSPILDRFLGAIEPLGAGPSLMRCTKNSHNAATVRELLPYLRPRPLGLVTSVGFGDRLGLATGGHVHALRDVSSVVPHTCVAPIFAQQSVRENSRTHRTPVQVLDDATWGCFEAGWTSIVGADADHLKTIADIDAFAAVGYSQFTIDPGAFVDPTADDQTGTTLQAELSKLPWDALESTQIDLIKRYATSPVSLESGSLSIGEVDIARAAVKYGRCIVHAASMARHVASKDIPYEIEVSVDETNSPTSPIEHYFIVSELRRLGVPFVGIAPRLPGRFEKGIDYIGDLNALGQSLILHSEIARVFGPHKLSLHSGSDKFSVYPFLAEATRGLVHLKTAGTSYLEALRVIASASPAFFRQICECAAEKYELERTSYHVSADAACMQQVGDMPDDSLSSLLDQDGPREVLHVTYGSILDLFGLQLRQVLALNESAYIAALGRHFMRHLLPFASHASRSAQVLQEHPGNDHAE